MARFEDEAGPPVTATDARQAVTGNGVRYVLGFSLLGVIAAFAILLFFWS